MSATKVTNTESFPLQAVKFYQTGTFTVGNRLLAEDERSVQAKLRRTSTASRPTGRGRTRSIPAIAPARAVAKRWGRATRSTRRCARPTTS